MHATSALPRKFHITSFKRDGDDVLEHLVKGHSKVSLCRDVVREIEISKFKCTDVDLHERVVHWTGKVHLPGH